MITKYIEQYLSHPEVFHKVARAFPQAQRGLPAGIEPLDATEAVYAIAKKAYLQKKQAQLVSDGLSRLEEL